MAQSTPGPDWQIEDFDLPAYFRVIGRPDLATTPGTPGIELLAELHRAHVWSLCFSNVDVVLESHPGVSPADINHQLLGHRRAGYCFEHAQLFAAAAESLGFRPRRALGRVHSPDNTRTHMSVVVPVDGRNWWCDPGFGFSILEPVELADGACSTVGARDVTVQRRGEGAATTWSLYRSSELQHVMDELPVVPADIAAGNFVTSQEPGSVFRQHLMVMRHREDGHVTITESGRTIRPLDGDTRHDELDEDAVVDAVVELGVGLTDDEREQLARRLAVMRVDAETASA